jgi:hypothetical protein
MKHVRPFLPKKMDTDYYAWSLKLATANELFETGSSFYIDLVTVKGPVQNKASSAAMEISPPV